MQIKIRKAENRDAKQILSLLSQVLELHAAVRPDIFIPGTTKYTEDELYGIFKDPSRLTFVAVDKSDAVVGYAFCEVIEHKHSNNIVPHTELYIDDLCVDSSARGRQIGRQLFLFVKETAGQMGCYEITLNVWEGNDGAKAFYDKMGMKPKSAKMELIL